jgi:WhiB family transcriptional regulator, redox-sensing transcriptional regulator
MTGSVDWMRDALCTEVGPDPFFPDPYTQPRDAKRVCARCPVQAPCLEYALETNQPDGVWGGTTPADRRRLKKGAA